MRQLAVQRDFLMRSLTARSTGEGSALPTLRQLLLVRFLQTRARLIVSVVNIRPRQHSPILSDRVVALSGEIQSAGSVEMRHRCQSLLRALSIGRSQKFFRRAFVLAGSHQRLAVFEMN